MNSFFLQKKTFLKISDFLNTSYFWDFFFTPFDVFLIYLIIKLKKSCLDFFRFFQIIKKIKKFLGFSGFCEIYIYIYIFFGWLSKLLRLVQKWPKMSTNSAKSSFFAGRAKKSLGQRPKPSAGARSKPT